MASQPSSKVEDSGLVISFKVHNREGIEIDSEEEPY
jgi:hypothetical protein